MTQRARRRKGVAAQPNYQINSTYLYGGVMGLLIVVGAIQFFSPENIERRAEKNQLRLEEIRQQAHTEQQRLEAEEGNRRYAAGCVMTYLNTPDAQGYYREILPLSPGMRIISDRSGRPIPDGQYVCDHQFMTFEIVNGRTANAARANNAALVNQRFNDYARWHPEARRGAIVEGKTNEP